MGMSKFTKIICFGLPCGCKVIPDDATRDESASEDSHVRQAALRQIIKLAIDHARICDMTPELGDSNAIKTQPGCHNCVFAYHGLVSDVGHIPLMVCEIRGRDKVAGWEICSAWCQSPMSRSLRLLPMRICDISPKDIALSMEVMDKVIDRASKRVSEGTHIRKKITVKRPLTPRPGSGTVNTNDGGSEMSDEIKEQEPLDPNAAMRITRAGINGRAMVMASELDSIASLCDGNVEPLKVMSGYLKGFATQIAEFVDQPAMAVPPRETSEDGSA